MSEKFEAALKVVISRREKLFRRIQNLYDLIAHLSDETKLEEFKTRFENLNETFTQFESTQEEIYSLSVKINKESLDPTTASTAACEDMYYKIMAAHKKYCAPQIVTRTEPQQEKKLVRPRLPEISLPKFDGTLTKWLTFYDNFVSLIHNNSGLTSTEKFHYLLSCLSGPALSIAHSLPITESNYDIVWKSLQIRYHNKRVLGNGLLDAIFSYQPITTESASTLSNFLTHFYEKVTALKTVGIQDLGDFILLNIALRNLPLQTRKLFEMQHTHAEIPTFELLAEFLQNQARILEMSEPISRVVKYVPTKPNKIRTLTPRPFYDQALTHTSALVKQKTNCPVCKQPHTIFKCPDFLHLTILQRKEQAKNLKLCFNCLKGSHQISACPSKTNCLKCGQRHHSFLHSEMNTVHQSKLSSTNTVNLPNSSTAVVQNNVLGSFAITDKSTLCHTNLNLGNEAKPALSVVLGTALIQIKDVNNSFQTVRALIDSAAQTSFITSSCAKRLGLPFKKSEIAVTGLAQNPVSETKGLVTCLLKSRYSENSSFTTEAIILPKITLDMPSMQVPEAACLQFKHLLLADPKFHKPGKIDFLIAADIFPYIYDGQTITSSTGLVALQSVFGWVITGKIHAPNPSTTLVSTCLTSSGNSIDDLLKRFWETEEIPREVPANPDDVRSEEMFSFQHYREPSGRYVVPMLLKDSMEDLGESYELANSRLRAIHRRLSRQPDLQAAYQDFLNQYLSLGHMEQVPSEMPPSGRFFIPHHCVIREMSSSTKLRVVFDASLQTTSGKSLNDMVFTGPKLQRDISEIIMRFRLHPFVLAADIIKMYRMILILPKERKYQHILWQETKDHDIKEFELKTLTYGVASSPFLALRVLKQLSLDDGHKYPQAASVLQEDIFMDDILTGSDTLEETLELRNQLIQLLACGGFELHKWSSNNPALLKDIPVQHQESPVSFDLENQHIIKLLGVQWTPSSDIFSYKIELPDPKPTKRSILSQIARIFDPLGWLTPVIMRGKCLLQQLWLSGLDWDDPASPHIEKEWLKFASQLKLLADIKINRFVLSENPIRYSIAGFSDASERGYGAVIYLIVQDRNSSIKSSLLIAKSKVAPLKTVSIPRLELCGALLLARLLKFTYPVLTKKLAFSETYLFTDSKTVLSWLKTPPHKLKTFVANRVCEVLDLTSPLSWNYVSSEDNPSDHASRGTFPEDLIYNQLWWSGPSWLSKSVEKWPLQEGISYEINCQQEWKPAAMVVSAKNKELESLISYLLPRVSSFSKLIRITAWCFRFVCNIRRGKQVHSYITADEWRKSLEFWLKEIQQQHFQSDIDALKAKKKVSNFLRKLNPFIDLSGFLRVGGRLRHADLPSQTKYPVVLPKKSHFTNLLIDYFHKSHLHVGPRALQALLQRQYWIISARSAIRSRLSKCLTCFKYCAANIQPKMGDLPAPRVSPGRPFENVGIDYGGPFQIKLSPLRNAKISKAYLSLFVCLSTKAVHLEAVSDLTTEAFLAAFQRFVSRRGLCAQVFSDCGTNFIGASRYLTGLSKYLEANRNEISSKFAQQGVRWHFNPPASPHFGGLWEAGIRSTKYHLKRISGEQPMTFEELTTLFTRIEAILNSRPLCALSSDPSEIDALTPGHFLIGAPLVSLPENDVSNSPLNRLGRWQLINQFTQHFWQRWKTEYLHTLQQRKKWSDDCPNVKIDDLVLLKEKSPVLHWRLGRIENVHPGKDNKVRVVTVKTILGSFRRPVVNIAPLPSA